MGVVREADDEIVIRLSSKTELRKWNEPLRIEVLKLVEVKLSDITEDIVPPKEPFSLMDRSIMSAIKARKFFVTTRRFTELGPADLERGGRGFY